MHNLLHLIIKYSAWIVFIIYVAISCSLLVNDNPYQHSLFLTSANSLSAGIYKGANNVSSYFNLREINYDLQRNNAELEKQVLNLKAQLQKFSDSRLSDSSAVSPVLNRYNFYIARVINNSVTKPHNYITIDKGAADGVKPEMGVVDQNGIVGIVNVVGPHSARVISFLNTSLKISCKIKRSQQVGSLKWDGLTPMTAILEELPRHATFTRGDTVVTSGYSTTFPEGVPVGVVLGVMKDYDENFFALRVKLFTDFSTLSTVRVIEDIMKDELSELETHDDNSESGVNGIR